MQVPCQKGVLSVLIDFSTAYFYFLKHIYLKKQTCVKTGILLIQVCFCTFKSARKNFDFNDERDLQLCTLRRLQHKNSQISVR